MIELDKDNVPQMTANAYLPREIGAKLASKAIEKRDDGTTHIIARLKCTIHSHRLPSDAEALESIEIKNWQLFSEDKKSWMPWAIVELPPPLPKIEEKPSKRVGPPDRYIGPDERAKQLLNLGSNFEKSGKTVAALEQYRRIVKEYATTSSAKAASERIKALEKK